MRILFSAPPDFGHTLPLLPLAVAAQRAGHEVAVLTHPSLGETVRPVQVLPAGPTFAALRAETGRRLTPAAGSAGRTPGMRSVGSGLMPEMLAELFVRVRLDLGGDEALEAARSFRPDLIVADDLDAVGPLVAAELAVPWAAHAFGLAPAPPFRQVLDRAMAERFAARGLNLTPRLAYVDLWPELLQPEGWTPPADRLAIRPRPYGQPDVNWTVPTFPDREDRPLVLVTLGTTVNDQATLETILSSLAAADVNIVVTLGTQEKADALEVDRSRVLPVGFVPLGQLLNGVDAVVSAAGAGTVLSILSRGLPAVFLPLLAEQPLNAERAAAAGAAVVVATPEEIGAAVQGALNDPSYRTAAQRVAAQIAAMNSPEQALDLLIGRTAQPSAD